MSEKRASKKQRELLAFIENFINSQGYGPSYREVMRALDYKSVSTVAVHIDGLIACGLLKKTDNSARSLEVVAKDSEALQEKDILAHVKVQINTCTEEQLRVVAESFTILQLPKLEKLVQKRLSEYK